MAPSLISEYAHTFFHFSRKASSFVTLLCFFPFLFSKNIPYFLQVSCHFAHTLSISPLFSVCYILPHPRPLVTFQWKNSVYYITRSPSPFLLSALFSFCRIICKTLKALSSAKGAPILSEKGLRVLDHSSKKADRP